MVDAHIYVQDGTHAPFSYIVFSFMCFTLLLRSYKSNKLLCLRRRKILSCCSLLFCALWFSFSLKLESVVTSRMYRKKKISYAWSVRSLKRDFWKNTSVRARNEEKLHETVSSDFKWSFSFCSVLFSFSA